MKYLYTLVLLLLTVGTVSAQSEDGWKEPSKESYAYHTARMENSEPPYSLKKIKALIAKIKMVGEEGEPDNDRLTPSIYQALSFREKFTYNMIHGDSYSQNCDAGLPVQDEHKKIFGQLPDAFGENAWSKRQLTFFSNNRDSVVKLLKENITKDGKIGLNYKHILVETNAKELVPFIIATYNKTKKDHDILTVLLLLMRNNEYQELQTSQTYKKLYSGAEQYNAFINFNTANEELIIKRATDFYNGLSH
ncbi:MAG: hypothetical protein QM731_17185 [Chitinophagaceae bacterium]